jgi:TetR/AcrR family transcriptional repressor of nem operon
MIDTIRDVAQRHPTSTAILKTAQRLIHERGFAATGMAEILSKSRTGSSSLYHHFDSKERLLAAILDDLGVRLENEILGPAIASSSDPVERVFAILEFYRDFLAATGCRLGCPVGNLGGEIADTHPRLRKRLEELFEAWRGGVARCLQPIAARLPRGTHPQDIAVFVLAVMEGAVLQARVAKSLAPFDRAVMVLRSFFDRFAPPEAT